MRFREILRESPKGGYLFHATPRHLVPAILEHGLRRRSYWADNEELNAYYVETIVDEGHEAAVFRVPLARFTKAHFSPDIPGLEEPIMTIVRERHDLDRHDDEEWVWHQWQNSGKTWQDCLALIGSVVYDAPLGLTEADLET